MAPPELKVLGVKELARMFEQFTYPVFESPEGLALVLPGIDQKDNPSQHLTDADQAKLASLRDGHWSHLKKPYVFVMKAPKLRYFETTQPTREFHCFYVPLQRVTEEFYPLLAEMEEIMTKTPNSERFDPLAEEIDEKIGIKLRKKVLIKQTPGFDLESILSEILSGAQISEVGSGDSDLNDPIE